MKSRRSGKLDGDRQLPGREGFLHRKFTKQLKTIGIVINAQEFRDTPFPRTFQKYTVTNLPKSLFFFVAVGFLALLQFIPYVGLIFVFVATFLPGALINLGMAGVAFEALIYRRLRYWLILPIAYIAGYWGMALWEDLRFQSLTAAYQAANSDIEIDFDPSRHALVFETDTAASWTLRNRSVPVIYVSRKDLSTGYIAHRLVEKDVFDQIAYDNGTLSGEGIKISSVYDDRPSNRRKPDDRVKKISMREKPRLPVMRVSDAQRQKRVEGTLPIVARSVFVETPDRQSHEFVSVAARRLPWFPQPFVGCAPTFSRKGTECYARFVRDRLTLFRYGTAAYEKEMSAIADALKLRPVTPETREPVSSAAILERIDHAVKDAVARQTERLGMLVENPSSNERLVDVTVLKNRPDILRENAGLIIGGLERAVLPVDQGGSERNWNTNDLAALVWYMPNDVIHDYGSRLISLFENTDKDHWLWRSSPLIQKLGYLGEPARSVLTVPELWRNGSGAGIAPVFAACVSGAPGRHDFEPLLLELWLSPKTNKLHRPELFVALRRIGVTPPDYEGDRFETRKRLSLEWADINPQSPASVCRVHSERKARKQKRSNSG